MYSYVCVRFNCSFILSLCRVILQQYGMWDQVRVDQGKEWVIMLYVQECLADYRRNTGRYPHVQSSSKQVGC